MNKAPMRISEQIEAHLIRSLKIPAFLHTNKQAPASHQNPNATKVL